MKTIHALRAGSVLRQRHKRTRLAPKWLRRSRELDALARGRCLLLLSVLSGETPVTAAIAQAKISRATYYKLETRALQAMLAALNPLAAPLAHGLAERPRAASRIAELEGRVRCLEQDKRRAERLLLLTRKSIRWPKRRAGGTSTPTSPGVSSP
ncbi:MAG: hypothetical protein ACREEP_10990 [Dongiaceae bacterium]